MKTYTTLFLSMALLGCCGANAGAEDILIPSALLVISDSVEIAGPEAGILVDLSVKEGSLVKRGQVIGHLDHRTAKLQLEQSQWDLSVAQQELKNDAPIRLAKKQHDLAVVDLQRSNEINAAFQGTVSARELDRLKLTVESTALEIEHAQFQQSQNALKIKRIESDVRLAQHYINQRTIQSPLDGMVVHVEKHPGEWAKQGDAIVRIVRVDGLRAEGFVDARTAMQKLVGRSAEIRVKVNNKDDVYATGQVSFVSPEVQPIDAQVRIWVDINNSKGQLRPGLSGAVKVLDVPSQTSLSAVTSEE